MLWRSNCPAPWRVCCPEVPSLCCRHCFCSWVSQWPSGPWFSVGGLPKTFSRPLHPCQPTTRPPRSSVSSLLWHPVRPASCHIPGAQFLDSSPNALLPTSCSGVQLFDSPAAVQTTDSGSGLLLPEGFWLRCWSHGLQPIAEACLLIDICLGPQYCCSTSHPVYCLNISSHKLWWMSGLCFLIESKFRLKSRLTEPLLICCLTFGTTSHLVFSFSFISRVYRHLFYYTCYSPDFLWYVPVVFLWCALSPPPPYRMWRSTSDLT